MGAILAGGTLFGGVASAATSPRLSPPPTKPGATTLVALPVLQNTAVLHGIVNPHGTSTTYHFEWGLTTAYGSSGSDLSAGSGTKPVTVRQTAGGLTALTTYHYRLVASNQLGTTVGTDHTFKTSANSPSASTGPVTRLSTTGATLTASVNPAGQATTWYFQWGTSTNYGQQTAAQSLPAGSSPQNVQSSLNGLLAPGTIYHYRVVAKHLILASNGDDVTFMTYPSPRPIPRVTASTKPKHALKRPYVFSTSGRVIGPVSIPALYACAGHVTIRFFNGSRQVAFTSAGVRPSCRFSGRTVFRHLPGRQKGHKALQLRVVTRFVSTPYLATSRARIEHIKLG